MCFLWPTAKLKAHEVYLTRLEGKLGACFVLLNLLGLQLSDSILKGRVQSLTESKKKKKRRGETSQIW